MSNSIRLTMKLLALAVAASAFQFAGFAQEVQADVYVASRPQNLTWGAFPIDKAPVATVKSGQTVRIDTLSHAGSTQDEPPAEFLGGYGVKRDEILQDVLDFWAARSTLRQPGGGGGHVLTGPIYVEGAEPGDTLEVQILSLRTRVPYGMNSGQPAAFSGKAMGGSRRATRRSTFPRALAISFGPAPSTGVMSRSSRTRSRCR
jgi:hypothetical protein